MHEVLPKYDSAEYDSRPFAEAEAEVEGAGCAGYERSYV